MAAAADQSLSRLTATGIIVITQVSVAGAEAGAEAEVATGTIVGLAVVHLLVDNVLTSPRMLLLQRRSLMKLKLLKPLNHLRLQAQKSLLISFTFHSSLLLFVHSYHDLCGFV